MTTLLTSPYWPHTPTHKQKLALALAGCPDLLFGGSRGGGKSDYVLMAASLFAEDPESKALVLRRTYRDLVRSGALLDRAIQWWGFHDDVVYDKGNKRFTFCGGSGGTIEFGHLGHSTAHFQYQGGEYTCLCIDESTLVPSHQIGFMRTCMRKRAGCHIPLMFRLTANPGNISHEYHKIRYVDALQTLQRRFIRSGLQDNPHIDQEAYLQQFDDLSPVERAQQLDGDWSVIPSTDFFELDNIRYADTAPTGSDWRWVRSWDYASTKAKPGRDPDWTSGALVGYRDGEVCVADVVKFREEPGQTLAKVKETAESDGTSVDIVGEQEPGSSGKTVSHTISRMLTGWHYTGIRPTGSKTDRAKAVASVLNRKDLIIVSGPHTHALVDEMRAFPDGPHDDQVDSISQGVGHLAAAPQFRIAW